MRVGMTNASGTDSDQHVIEIDNRNLDSLLFQRRTDFRESNGFHSVAVALWATFGITQRNISRVARRTATRLQKMASLALQNIYRVIASPTSLTPAAEAWMKPCHSAAPLSSRCHQSKFPFRDLNLI